MAGSPMKQFARSQVAALFNRLVKTLHRAAQKQDADAVHQMRVSIRRFDQCLTVFEQYVPERESKKLRKHLRRVMRLSSKVRDLDIAILFLKKQRFPAGNLADQRECARLDLADALEWSPDEAKLAG